MHTSNTLPVPRNTFLLYQEVRSALKIPLKMEIYFDLLQYSLTQNINQKYLKNKQGFSTDFIRAFLTLSKQQRQQILLANISSLFINYHRIATTDAFQQQNQSKQKQLLSQLPTYDKFQNCQGKCYILTLILGMPYWQKANFNLQSKKRNINIHSNHSILIDLRLYLLRKSKKHDNTLVLQSVSNKTQKNYSKVSLNFNQSSLFEKVYQLIFSSIVSHRNHQLVEQFQKDQQQELQRSTQIQPDTSGIQLSVRPLVFLNQKHLNDYLMNKKTIKSYLQILSSNFFPIHKRNQITISKNSMDGSFYKLQNTFHIKKEQVKKILHQKLSSYSFVTKWEVLQTFSNKYQAIYQKFYIRGKKLQQIVIVEERKQATDFEEVLFIKHVDCVINKSFMEFCIFLIQKLPGSSCKLSIYGCFNPILLGGIENLIYLLEQYVNIVTGEKPQIPSYNSGGHQLGSTISKDDFFTILDDFQNYSFSQAQRKQIQKQIKLNAQKMQKKRLDTIQQLPLSQRKTPIRYQQNKITSTNPIDKYLFHQYVLSALPKDQVPQKIQKDNWLQVQWGRAKGGGLVCKNQKLIQQQRKLYKKLLVSFGQQIIKSKGILNLSIPVIIFKKQSQLFSMAKTFKMAPYFFERAVHQTDTFQKFKYVIAGLISINSLNLSNEKPFNPILGQTLQVSVNGCPIYIQQISHHPPISSYYFVGRGYKVYGTAEIKIDIGLNNAKGYSQLSHIFQFDNGQKIEFLFPKLLIGGMLFGQRTFNFEGKTFVYDHTNRIYADLYFGQTKKTFFASQSHPEDQVSGKIYQMKQSFDSFFNKNRPLIDEIDKKDIDKQLFTVSGVWNTSVKIGQKAYTQFVGANVDPIYELEEDDFVLPSDSRYRKDLQYLIEGKVDKAQQAKVQMEQSQRKDKKLRLQYKQKRR